MTIKRTERETEISDTTGGYVQFSLIISSSIWNTIDLLDRKNLTASRLCEILIISSNIKMTPKMLQEKWNVEIKKYSF